MTFLLRDIVPPHEPRDDAKLSSLVTAYNDGADFGALCGALLSLDVLPEAAAAALADQAG